jgi:hypothetical protein
VFQTKSADDEVNVDPGVGLVICAGVGDAIAVVAM